MGNSHGRSDGQVLKGLLDTLVLHTLSKDDDYGFGIKEKLGAELNGASFVLRETTLYPLLHRLEDRGYVQSYCQPGSKGKPRRYYRLTQSGREHLSERETEWRTVSSVLARTVLKTKGDQDDDH